MSGKSSDGPDGWPYFNLQEPGSGVILAVGWPGPWEASFARDHDRGLRVTAGQQFTHLVLHPGEEIRTPSITLLFWQGDDVVRAQNRAPMASRSRRRRGRPPGHHGKPLRAGASPVLGTVRGFTEMRRIAPLLLGDYHPLTPYSLDRTSWIAWQFHRPDVNEGVVQAFHRPEAAGDTLAVKLRGLDPERRYEVENLDGGKEVHSGAELMRGLDITLRERPAAAVLVVKGIP